MTLPAAAIGAENKELWDVDCEALIAELKQRWSETSSRLESKPGKR